MPEDLKQEPTDFQQKTGETQRISRFQRVVLEGLFYLVTDRGASLLPSPEEYLISAIVAGTCEYVNGQEFQEGHTECQGFARDPWIRKINRNLDTLDNQSKFNPALAAAIKHWTRIKWCYYHGESWWESQIRYWLMFGKLDCLQSTFALTVPQAREIEEELKTLDPDTLRHVEGIAEAMKKYVQRDLEYVREHYWW